MLVELGTRANMRFLKFKAADFLDFSSGVNAHTQSFFMRPAFISGRAMSSSMFDTVMYQVHPLSPPSALTSGAVAGARRGGCD